MICGWDEGIGSRGKGGWKRHRVCQCDESLRGRRGTEGGTKGVGLEGEKYLGQLLGEVVEEKMTWTQGRLPPQRLCPLSLPPHRGSPPYHTTLPPQYKDSLPQHRPTPSHEPSPTSSLFQTFLFPPRLSSVYLHPIPSSSSPTTPASPTPPLLGYQSCTTLIKPPLRYPILFPFP